MSAWHSDTFWKTKKCSLKPIKYLWVTFFCYYKGYSRWENLVQVTETATFTDCKCSYLFLFHHACFSNVPKPCVYHGLTASAWVSSLPFSYFQPLLKLNQIICLLLFFRRTISACISPPSFHAPPLPHCTRPLSKLYSPGMQLCSGFNPHFTSLPTTTTTTFPAKYLCRFPKLQPLIFI